MAKQSRAIAVTEHDNKCPECLHLEISGEPVAPESKGVFSLLKKSDPEAFSLSVRIIFNQQWLDFSFGRVKFGLRGGELRLKLENGQMPSELRNEALKKILARELEIERQLGGEQESKSQLEGSITPDLSKANLKGVREKRQKESQGDKFQLKIAQISHKGANNQPVWVFENRTGEPVLIGELADSLGKMLIAGVPWSVEATFTHEMRQVVITGLENLFKDDISGHKLNVFELAVAKLFLKHKTQPYLSRQVLRYE
ncbi:MAG: hypothetical protein ACK4YL_23165 [Microcystis sp.]|uniref:Uncharacterized protein n=1 Tax=Microcystis flos-aquae Mf_QC_C_20070823_S10D TaxID=2486236 RepID=A0A552KW03_9CHRO|nr:MULTISPECIES: hypothetical protein [unclassified Microcystis]MCA2628994.1 hypothetical protein [Microcystis sp. M091S2]MCA2677925.1 hypothetical protein [Microcystis sp. M054S2]MCA2817712.1 hypothetical protein [Microcystis sp. M085S1]MCA2853948.1 hypothetical protein [Microcystis sp. M065S1]MDJ0586839.1 hypothetical protein [Microcystis sp. M49636_WE2]TRT82022.1 MAG: hypothetical protein EWV64_00395 [Microcystis flos-aquae Ma_QC_C_20070823_S18]TRT94137.1 MAG: hypothetical protein EWV65_1